MDGFPADTLDLIQKTAVNASGAKDKIVVLPYPNDPLQRSVLVSPDGTFTEVEPGPAPRKVTLLSVDQVLGFCESHRDNCSVWISPSRVEIVIDDSKESRRLERAVVPLDRTIANQTLQTFLDDETELDQKSFIRVLRLKLFDCLDKEGRDAITVLRTINFSNSTTGHGVVEKSRESLGREIEAEVRSDAGEIPDELLLNIRLYEDRALQRRFTIRCALEIDSRKATFSLCPLPGQLEDAVATQMQMISEMLVDSCDRVFFGTP